MYFAMLTRSARLPFDAVAMMNFDLSRRNPEGESGQPSRRCQARLRCCFASSRHYIREAEIGRADTSNFLAVHLIDQSPGAFTAD